MRTALIALAPILIVGIVAVVLIVVDRGPKHGIDKSSSDYRAGHAAGVEQGKFVVNFSGASVSQATINSNCANSAVDAVQRGNFNGIKVTNADTFIAGCRAGFEVGEASAGN